MPACLESILSQEFTTPTEFEIIGVNDGSTDRSPEILEEYAKKDSRVKVVHQPNSGAAVARNAGLEVARGEYLLFFDGDDIMMPNMLNSLYHAAFEQQADVVTCQSEQQFELTGARRVLDNSPKMHFVQKYSKRLGGNMWLIEPQQAARNIMQTFVAWPWDKLIRRQFVLDYDLKYQALRHSNDAYFIFMALMLANKIVFIENVLVTHRTYSQSISATRVKAPECFYEACMEIYRAMHQYEIYDVFRLSYVNFCIDFALWHINTVGNLEAQQLMVKKAGELLVFLSVDLLPDSAFNTKKLKVLGRELIELGKKEPLQDYSRLNRRVISIWEILTDFNKLKRLIKLDF